VGAASPNMILQMENMNKIGAAGDRHFVPVNMVPIELAGQNIVPQQPASAPADPAEPADPTDPADPAGPDTGDAPPATTTKGARHGHRLFH
jgi:hypothetical protein